MKNEILDDIFKDKIYWSLEKGEKIIWEGKPYFNGAVWSKSFLSLVLRLGVVSFLFIWFFGGLTLLFLIFMLLVFHLDIIKFIKKQKTRYLITDRKIVFQLWEPTFDKTVSILKTWKSIHNVTYSQYQSISFYEIKNIIIFKM